MGTLLLALAYAFAALLGGTLEVAPVNVSPVWPAAGVALAGLLLYGRSLWPGVFLGSFSVLAVVLVASTESLPRGLLTAAGVAAGASASAVFATFLVQRFALERVPPHSLRGLAALVGLGALIGPLPNTLIGTAMVGLAGYVEPHHLAGAAASWWLGDVVGILVAAPPLLLLGERHPIGPSRSVAEALLLLFLFLVVGAVAFGPWVPATRQYQLAYLALPLLVWAALRFGLAGAAAGNLLVASMAITWTAARQGPFAGLDVGESLRLLQIFVVVVSVTFLALAVVMEERAAAHRALSAARRELRNQVEEQTRALRHSLALLRATLDATADGILVVDGQGRIVSFNRRFLELWRLPRSLLEAGDDRAAIGAVLSQLEDPDGFRARVEELYGHPTAEAHDLVQLRDGRIFDRFSRPQWLDGQPVGRVWSFRDVTARRLAERERDRLLVQEQQARREAEQAHARTIFLSEASRALATSMSFAATARRVVGLALAGGGRFATLYLVDASGRPAPVAAAHFDGAAIGWLLEEDGGAPPVPNLDGRVRSTLEAGRSQQWRGDGELGPVLCVPLASRGRFIGVLAVGRRAGAGPFRREDAAVLEELGQRSALSLENAALLREAQEAVRVRDDFLSIASHELKTPLTTLKLQLQKMERILRRDPTDTRIAGLLQSVVRQSGRLHALIDELLDLSRITTHRIALVSESLDFGELVAESVERSREPAARAGSSLLLATDGDLHGSWDRVRLEQVVGNLVSNAVKYGAGRPIEVRVLDEGELVRLDVEDHGIGISPEDQARIFERFERAVASRHYGGFGLGLWIVRQVVEAMGGRIWVESVAGRGSTFSVELPRGQPQAAMGEHPT